MSETAAQSFHLALAPTGWPKPTGDLIEWLATQPEVPASVLADLAARLPDRWWEADEVRQALPGWLAAAPPAEEAPPFVIGPRRPREDYEWDEYSRRAAPRRPRAEPHPPEPPPIDRPMPPKRRVRASARRFSRGSAWRFR